MVEKNSVPRHARKKNKNKSKKLKDNSQKNGHFFIRKNGNFEFSPKNVQIKEN